MFAQTVNIRPYLHSAGVIIVLIYQKLENKHIRIEKLVAEFLITFLRMEYGISYTVVFSLLRAYISSNQEIRGLKENISKIDQWLLQRTCKIKAYQSESVSRHSAKSILQILKKKSLITQNDDIKAVTDLSACFRLNKERKNNT